MHLHAGEGPQWPHCRGRELERARLLAHRARLRELEQRRVDAASSSHQGLGAAAASTSLALAYAARRLEQLLDTVQHQVSTQLQSLSQYVAGSERARLFHQFTGHYQEDIWPACAALYILVTYH